MTSRTSVELHFSKSSALYEQEARLQRLIAERLVADIASRISPQTILDAGCGTGFLTEQLIRLFPGSAMTAIDLAAPMLETLRMKLGARSVRLIQGDAAAFDYGERYDLIVSSSAMQWMVPLERSVRHLAHHLRPGGVLLFSLMLQGTFSELHELRRKLFPAKQPRAALPSSSGVEEAVTAGGLVLETAGKDEFCQSFDSASSFFRQIKGQGFTGGPLSLGEKPLTRGELALLITELEQAMRGEGGITARYVVGFYRAVKPEG